jgi:hypothetical protein
MQISEQVEALFVILEKWEEQGQRGAAQVDEAAQVAIVQELLPSIAAVRGIEPRLAKMHQKAMEPDPDLQTYGPVMKEKILQLHARFLLLASLADSVEACYDETAGKAKEDVHAAAARAKQLEEEEALRAKQEEDSAILREKAQRQVQREREKAERDAALALEAKRREEARAKVVEAEERERAAALVALACNVQQRPSESRWVTDPVLEGDGEELTIEKAIELEEQATARRAALQVNAPTCYHICSRFRCSHTIHYSQHHLYPCFETEMIKIDGWPEGGTKEKTVSAAEQGGQGTAPPVQFPTSSFFIVNPQTGT